MRAKILMLIPTLNLVGGAQDQLKILSNQLNAYDIKHDIKTIYSYKKDNRYKFFSEISLFFKLIIFSIKYRVIHLHGLGSSLYFLGFLSQIFKFSLIVKVPRSGEGSYINELKKNKFKFKLFKFTSNGVKKFVALTACGEIALKDLGISSHKIIRIPNGVYIPSADPINKKDEVLNICYVGRLIKRKRINLILGAAKILKDKGINNYHVSIIGDGPELKKLELDSKKLGIKDRVRFFGEVENKVAIGLLKSMDIFILPSESEGMSNSLLQACANSCVPIASDIPQNLEIITPNINGLVFSSQAQLVSHIETLFDIDTLKVFKDKAYKNVKLKYDIKKIAKEYSMLYEES